MVSLKIKRKKKYSRRTNKERNNKTKKKHRRKNRTRKNIFRRDMKGGGKFIHSSESKVDGKVHSYKLDGALAMGELIHY